MRAAQNQLKGPDDAARGLIRSLTPRRRSPWWVVGPLPPPRWLPCRARETALQEGLAGYEAGTGRARFTGAETSLAERIKALEHAASGDPAIPAWQEALENARLPLFDVHWTGRSGRTGGRQDSPLRAPFGGVLKKLKPRDVIRVRVVEDEKNPYAEARVRPRMQGAAVVLENKTGRVLAMIGGFSYVLSQFTRRLFQKARLLHSRAVGPRRNPRRLPESSPELFPGPRA
jgi:hypothetical protein